MKWTTCTTGCGEEFRVITEALEPITFCPLCGEDLEYEEDEDQEWDE